MAALAALLAYYVALLTTPTPGVAFLIAISSSPRLTAVYKAAKWCLRVVCRQGSEIQHILHVSPASATGYIRLPEDEPSGSSQSASLGAATGSNAPNTRTIATWRINYSILHSRQVEGVFGLEQSGDADKTGATIMKAKGIYSSPEAQEMLNAHISSVVEMRSAVSKLVERSQQTFSRESKADSAKLRQLWNLLQPEGVELPENMQTKLWQDLGFQNKDPSTDWRSVGLLGLDAMLYFAKTAEGARSIVREAIKPSGSNSLGWYPFALAYITITDFALRLLKLNSLSWLLLSSSTSAEETFHHAVSLLVVHFHKHWQYLQESEDPQEASRARPVVMDFERVIRRWKIEVTRWVERGRIAGWVDSRGFVEEAWLSQGSEPDKPGDSPSPQ